MEEKIIIKKEKMEFRKVFKTILIITAISLVFFTIMSWFVFCHEQAIKHIDRVNRNRTCWYCYNEMSAIGCALAFNAECDGGAFWYVAFCPPLGIMLVGIIIYLLANKMEIIVTNKRVYGKTYFGKDVDLPLDSISAVGTRWIKGICVSTSSGLISFILIKNAKEIREEIRKLLLDRQEKRQMMAQANIAQTNSLDELAKLKELLENNVITQEEFDAKKKQILGL